MATFRSKPEHTAKMLDRLTAMFGTTVTLAGAAQLAQFIINNPADATDAKGGKLIGLSAQQPHPRFKSYLAFGYFQGRALQVTYSSNGSLITIMPMGDDGLYNPKRLTARARNRLA